MTDALTRCCKELTRVGEKLHAVTAERDAVLVDRARVALDLDDALQALQRVMRYALAITHHDVEDEKHARAILAKHKKVTP